MIKLQRTIKINKTPDYNGEKYGKVQISSKKLAELVGKTVDIEIVIYDESDRPIISTGRKLMDTSGDSEKYIET